MGRQEMALVVKVSSAAYSGHQGAGLQWGPVSAKHTPLAMQKGLWEAIVVAFRPWRTTITPAGTALVHRCSAIQELVWSQTV